jgi:serine/threonine protein kinase
MTEYAILFQDIPFPADIDPHLKDVISRLLDVNAETRLGAAEIRAHPFYADVDWSRLEQKHVVPPFIPTTRSLEETPQFQSFEALMSSLGKNSWLTELPEPKLQKYFNSW